MRTANPWPHKHNKAMSARHQAMRWLVENHKTEFEHLHRQARISFGLSDLSETPVALKDRVALLEEQLHNAQEGATQ